MWDRNGLYLTGIGESVNSSACGVERGNANLAYRAKKLLGWTATHETLEQEILRAVEEEARVLGLLKDPISAS
ncbi:hypothetical protein ANO14919_126160 [Xylariales sp. No.14919]|nr:hypothetical protein ANO14919_126160 [Xylariales sp. No.14919]